MAVPVVNVILAMSVFYSTVDVALNWAKYAECERPLNVWLLVSFVLMALYRIGGEQLISMGSRSSEDPFIDCILLEMLQLPPRAQPPRASAVVFRSLATSQKVRRCAGLPVLVFWTALGSRWLRAAQRQSPECLPDDGRSWFFSLWLLACALVIFVDLLSLTILMMLHLQYSCLVRRLHVLDTAEILRRWGREYVRSPYNCHHAGGLSPKLICELPIGPATQKTAHNERCAICLDEFATSETLRTLPLCSHSFHQA